MFIQIIYGNSSVLLINPESRLQHILSLIRRKCGIDADRDIELLPLDEGENVPLLYTRLKSDYLSPYVTHREIYVPAYVTLDKKGTLDSVEPQVTDWAEKYPDLDHRIREMTDKRVKKKVPPEKRRKTVAAVLEQEDSTEFKKPQPAKKEKKKKSGKKS